MFEDSRWPWIATPLQKLAVLFNRPQNFAPIMRQSHYLIENLSRVERVHDRLERFLREPYMEVILLAILNRATQHGLAKFTHPFLIY
jgi:hypothetical protein